MITIAYLADHHEAVPVLARWFRAQWPVYFAGKSQAEIEAGFVADANRSHIPVRLIAYLDDELAGTLVLRDLAMDSAPDLHPGLGGLYVAEPYRRRGVGTAMINACMDLAHGLGYTALYAGTSTAHSLFERLGWESIRTILEGQERVVLYRYTFQE